MRSAYDAAQVRAAEAPLLAALPEGALMQRAATALAVRCATELGSTYGSRVVLLVGSGGNGGDALYAGARLAARGARVDAVLASDRVHEPGLAALRAAGGRSRAVTGPGAADEAERQLLAGADLVVDGLLGIGATGELREPMRSLVGRLAGSEATVVAVDVASGVDASTGEVAGRAVSADVTVCFGALKTGLVVSPGAQRCGRVETVDIGLEPGPAQVELLEAADVAAIVPEPQGETDKYRRGVVGIVAGSDTYPGAARLAVGGALGAGVGMVRYAGTAGAADGVRTAWPEVLVTSVEPGDGHAVLDVGRVQAWVIGSGLGTDDDAGRLVTAVLGTDLPVLVDADALSWLAAHPELVHGRSAPTLLTPHAGELARLIGWEREDIEARRLAALREAVDRWQVTVLLKGLTSVVADPSGRVRVNPVATSYLGTAGSGDTLSGICGALLAGGCDALDAGSAGAYLHGLAGVLAAGSPAAGFTPTQLGGRVADAVRSVRAAAAG